MKKYDTNNNSILINVRRNGKMTTRIKLMWFDNIASNQIVLTKDVEEYQSIIFDGR